MKFIYAISALITCAALLAMTPFWQVGGTRIRHASSRFSPLERRVMSLNVSSALQASNPTVSGVTLTPSSVTGGSTSLVTVTITSPAPAAGVNLVVSSSNVAAKIPSSLKIAAGQTTLTFSVATVPVHADTNAVIAANSLGTSTKVTANLTIKAAVISTLALASPTIVSGNSVTGTVTLTGPAGPGGRLVALVLTTWFDPAIVKFPTTVSVPEGLKSVNFTLSILPNNGESGQPVLVAKTGPISASFPFRIDSPTPLSLTGTTSIKGGLTAHYVYKLNGRFSKPVDIIIDGSQYIFPQGSPNPDVPGSATIPAGQDSVAFTAGTAGVDFDTKVGVTVRSSGGGPLLSASTTLTKATFKGISLDYPTIFGGAKSIATVKLDGAAGPVGTYVDIKGPGAPFTYLRSFKISNGDSQVSFEIQTGFVSSKTVGTFTASGLGSSSSCNLVLNPVNAASIVLPTSITRHNYYSALNNAYNFDQFKLQPKVVDSKGAEIIGAPVVWSIDDGNIAQLSAVPLYADSHTKNWSGWSVAGESTAIITAVSGNKKATCKLIVKAANPIATFVFDGAYYPKGYTTSWGYFTMGADLYPGGVARAIWVSTYHQNSGPVSITSDGGLWSGDLASGVKLSFKTFHYLSDTTGSVINYAPDYRTYDINVAVPNATNGDSPGTRFYNYITVKPFSMDDDLLGHGTLSVLGLAAHPPLTPPHRGAVRSRRP